MISNVIKMYDKGTSRNVAKLNGIPIQHETA